MSETIDMIKLVKELPGRPRGRACVVLTHEYGGQKDWGGELARQTGMKHIDLLDLFAGNEELSEKVSSLTVKELFSLLQERGHSLVLIVTGIEFLTATWTGYVNATEQFASHVEMWSKPPALLFVMQFDAALAKRKFTRYPQYAFVVDQKETFALR